MKLTKIVFLFLISFFLILPAYALEISGIVVRVLDGDTIHLLSETSLPPHIKTHKNQTVSIRFRGIDAPEKDQPFGPESKENLKRLIENKKVIVDIKDVDRYGRIAGYIYCNGKNINLEQVRQGYAWAYTEYLDRPYASEFYNAEKEARKNKLGLWKQSNPKPPWEWRKINKK